MSLDSTKPTQIAITGFGLVTPLGYSAWETFSSLLDHRTLADRVEAVSEEGDGVDLVRSVGCVKMPQHTATDPAIELAERAAREALLMANVQPSEVGGVIGVSKGAMHALITVAESYVATRNNRAFHTGEQRLALESPSATITDAERVVAWGPHAYLAHHLQTRWGSSLSAPPLQLVRRA